MARTSLMNAMLSSSLVVVGLAVLVAAELDPVIVSECPKNTLRNETVQIPHEYDCTKYYTCLGSKKVLRECPFMDGDGNRLYFNPELQLCDWPSEAGCNLPLPIIKMVRNRSYKDEPIPTKCPKIDSKYKTVHLAYQGDCTKFYTCLQGKKIPMSCPVDQNGDKLYFNPAKQVCDWPFNVDCQMPQLRMKKTLVDCDAPTKCPRIDPINTTVHIADNKDCTKFYKCLQGTPLPMSCPPDEEGIELYFNPCEQVCDWRYNVECNVRKALKPMSIELSALKSDYPTKCPKIDPKNETILLPYDGDCTKFYSCSRGRKIAMNCPEYNEDHDKLYFNPEIHQCDWPENVDCDTSILLSKPKSSEPRVGLPSECPKYDSVNETVLLPHESDSTKFYVCSHGNKVLKQCPVIEDEDSQLYFNFEEQICDWGNNVHYKLPLTIMRLASNKEILPVPTECPARDSPEYTVHLEYPGDCTRFYKCFNGYPYPMQCPTIGDTRERLYFNKVLQVCDWPWEAGCDWDGPTRPPPTTRPAPTYRPTTQPRPTYRPTTQPRPTYRPTTQPRPTNRPTTRPPPTTTPTPDPDIRGCLETCPNDDPPNFITALPHADCRKWCRCENHIVRVWPCPGNLEFSPTLRVCTGPDIAGCKKRWYPHRSRGASDDDEALMNILGYNERFKW